VTRATLYRHFATEAELFAACSADWLRENPRPDLSRWSAVTDPAERLGTALREMYIYYRSTQAMLANLYRDIDSLPPPVGQNLAGYPDQMLDVLDRGWSARTTGTRRVRRAAIRHAVEFGTWQSLAEGGLADEEAAGLMTTLVIDANDKGRRLPAR
jgi:AcrR family transcriptional regulator